MTLVEASRPSAVDVDPGTRHSSWWWEVDMRKLIVSELITLDGVMQAPGGVL